MWHLHDVGGESLSAKRECGRVTHRLRPPLWAALSRKKETTQERHLYSHTHTRMLSSTTSLNYIKVRLHCITFMTVLLSQDEIMLEEFSSVLQFISKIPGFEWFCLWRLIRIVFDHNFYKDKICLRRTRKSKSLKCSSCKRLVAKLPGDSMLQHVALSS